MTLSDRLGGFLDHAIDTPFGYGAFDCQLFPSDWVKLVTGVDPAAAWRGAYSDEAGAMALIAAAGGLRKLAAGAMAKAGLKTVFPPVAGDVGLVRIRGHEALNLAGGICVRAGIWTSLTQGGLIEGPAYAVVAWSVAERA